jgi:phage terminase large subunit-like protein
MLAEWIFQHPPTVEQPAEWGIVAPTFGDARRKCVEGPSGLLKVLGGQEGPLVENWNRSSGELYLVNGAKVFLDGADDGALRVQGENLRGLWASEIGLWKDWETSWKESIQFAVRLAPAKIVCEGTPKGMTGLVKLLVQERKAAPEDFVFTRTYLEDNESNLVPAQIASLRRQYAGTRLGHQELGGEILDDVEGALWTWAMIDGYRCALPTEGASRTVVAIDPAITAGEDSDETGIVAVTRYGSTTPFPKANLVAGEAVDHAFVRADRSGRYSPRGWAAAAIECYHELKADRIVYEKNQGGEMVAATIRSVDPNVPLSGVWASQGKRTRAEPVSALYEQGRVHHVEPFPELESEMTAWVPGEPSPSRMDALVWAITDLMLEGNQDYAFTGEQDRSAEVEAPITAGLLDRRW